MMDCWTLQLLSVFTSVESNIGLNISEEWRDSNNEQISAGGPGPAQLQPPGEGRGGRGGGRERGGVGGQLDIQVCHRVLLRMTFEQGNSSLSAARNTLI